MLEEHQGGPTGTDRAPKGWVRTYLVTVQRGRPHDHPLQPLQGFRGPLRCHGTLRVLDLAAG